MRIGRSFCCLTAAIALHAFFPAAEAQEAARQPGFDPDLASHSLSFEVVSVKPASPPKGVTISPEGGVTAPRGSRIGVPRNTGGPGTQDAGRIHYPLISIKALIQLAYPMEIVSPEWLNTRFVAIDATMPRETTSTQFQEMLRSLLLARFKLQFHTATREVTGYSLVVAKDGPKMQLSPPVPEAQPDSAPRAGPRQQYKRGADGFPILPRPDPAAALRGPFCAGATPEDGRTRLYCYWRTMQNLAQQLSMELGVPVSDSTGLTEKYDFTLTFASRWDGHDTVPMLEVSESSSIDGPAPLPDLFTALQSQIGIKLVPQKSAIKSMIIDHVEKVPVRE